MSPTSLAHMNSQNSLEEKYSKANSRPPFGKHSEIAILAVSPKFKLASSINTLNVKKKGDKNKERSGSIKRRLMENSQLMGIKPWPTVVSMSETHAKIESAMSDRQEKIDTARKAAAMGAKTAMETKAVIRTGRYNTEKKDSERKQINHSTL